MLHQLVTSVILGLAEGVTEFLPISSTGHLILVNQWFSFSPQFTKLFDVVIQLGAVLAVVVYFWGKLWPFGQGEAHRRSTFSLWGKTLVGVLPAIVFGALFGTKVEAKLFNPLVVGAALFLGGVVLVLVERRRPRATVGTVADVSLGTAFCIGLVQCLALIPGTSRSAATIVGAMLLGASRPVAVEFSFYLAVPTIAAASAYSILKHGLTMTGSEAAFLVLGFAVTFFTALAVVRKFMGYIQHRSFTPFGYYRIALGLLVLLWLAL